MLQTGTAPRTAPSFASGAGKPGARPVGDESTTPGDQERPMSEDEALDEALEETFPTSDPISPSRIDGPHD